MERQLTLVAFTLIASLLSAQQNVLLIIADDLGLDPVPGYLNGPQKATMPTLVALMDNGLTFDRAWADPICSPTRATIITGRQGYETGVLGVTTMSTLALSETTVFEYLDQINSGYAMAAIGKWHLGGMEPAADDPALQGVPYFTGILDGGVQDYWSWPQVTNGVLNPNTEYITEVLTDSAIAWIGAQGTPWFCWLAYNAPHSPFHLPPKDLHTQGPLPTDSASIAADPLPYYLAMIESLDHEIGRLLDAMDLSVRENTTILFIGDNGTPGQVVQAPYQPFRAKGSLYQGGVHVPLVVSGAGVERTGEREDALVSSSDLFATVVELTGHALPVYASSKSLVPMLSEADLLHRDCVRADVIGAQGVGQAVRNDRYKLISLGDGTERFYDLQADPYESDDLLPGSLSVQQQEAYEALLAGCLTIVGITGSQAPQSVGIRPNPSTGTIQVDHVPMRGTVWVVDRMGSVAMERFLERGSTTLDLGGLEPGVYVLRGVGIRERFVLMR